MENTSPPAASINESSCLENIIRLLADELTEPVVSVSGYVRQSAMAADLFSYFTADIIKEEVIFTR